MSTSSYQSPLKGPSPCAYTTRLSQSVQVAPSRSWTLTSAPFIVINSPNQNMTVFSTLMPHLHVTYLIKHPLAMRILMTCTILNTGKYLHATLILAKFWWCLWRDDCWGQHWPDPALRQGVPWGCWDGAYRNEAGWDWDRSVTVTVCSVNKL